MASTTLMGSLIIHREAIRRDCIVDLLGVVPIMVSSFFAHILFLIPAGRRDVVILQSDAYMCVYVHTNYSHSFSRCFPAGTALGLGSEANTCTSSKFTAFLSGHFGSLRPRSFRFAWQFRGSPALGYNLFLFF